MTLPRDLTAVEYKCISILVAQCILDEIDASKTGQSMSEASTNLLIGLAGLFKVDDHIINELFDVKKVARTETKPIQGKRRLEIVR